MDVTIDTATNRAPTWWNDPGTLEDFDNCLGIIREYMYPGLQWLLQPYWLLLLKKVSVVF